MSCAIEVKTMPPMDSVVLDRDHYYKQVLQGFYHFPSPDPQGKVWEAKLYVPEGIDYNRPLVYLAIPEQTDAAEFAVRSGWRAFADSEKLYLVLMEPEHGSWGTDSAQWMVYIAAVMKKVASRPLFSAFAPRMYGAGYDKGADVMMQYGLRQPQTLSGLLLAGCCGISQTEAEKLRQTPSKEPSIMLSQVQMPVWITAEGYTEQVAELVSYYRKANHSGPEPAVTDQTASGVSIYFPVEGGTEDEYWCAQTIYQEQPWRECLHPDFCKKVYETLWKGTCRYAGNRIGALRHHGDMKERGFRYFSERVPGGYSQDPSDYYRREWWVYEPETACGKKKIPVVFLFHGAGGCGEEIGDRSGWAQVAEKHGFLLVCPTASVANVVNAARGALVNQIYRSRWNTAAPKPEVPGDLEFLDYLYQWMLDHYPVDKSRVYASGQSSGGTMAWAAAMYRPDYFAAVAPVSAKCVNMMEKTAPYVRASLVPVMASMGVEDTIFPGGFSTEDAKEVIDYWCQRFETTKTWSDYTYMDDGKSASFIDGLFANYLFDTRAGVTVLRMMEVKTKAHAIWPCECRMIWEEWFVHFTKDEDTKVLYWNGSAVTV